MKFKVVIANSNWGSLEMRMFVLSWLFKGFFGWFVTSLSNQCSLHANIFVSHWADVFAFRDSSPHNGAFITFATSRLHNDNAIRDSTYIEFVRVAPTGEFSLLLLLKLTFFQFDGLQSERHSLQSNTNIN